MVPNVYRDLLDWYNNEVIGLNDLSMGVCASLDAHWRIGANDKFVLLCANDIRIDMGIFVIVL